MEDPSGMQVTHPRRNLLHNVHRLLHRESFPPDVKVFVESGPSAETAEEMGRSNGCGQEAWLYVPSDDGKVGRSQGGTHEQSQVVVSRLLQNGDLHNTEEIWID